MPVRIHNKDYLTVAERIATFRGDHKDWCINTDIISNADLIVIKAVISNEKGEQIGSGYAEEVRGSSAINKTSALENCETSAIGRALASCGYGGEQYSSANEVSEAVLQQARLEAVERLKLHSVKVREHLQSILVIKDGIASGDLSSAAEAWNELIEDDQRALWISTRDGGIFQTSEREVMKTTEFREANS